MYSVSIVQYASSRSIQYPIRSVSRSNSSDVPLHGLPTPLVELGDPERLDVALAGGADLLLDLELDRQAVAVPAALARDEVPGHRLEARVDVLEGARLHVVHAGLAVRRGRSLVEHPQRGVGALGQRARGRRRASFQNARMPRSSSGKLTFGSTGSNRAIAPRPPHAHRSPLPRPMRNASSHRCRDEASGPAVPPSLPGPRDRRPLTAADHGLPRSRAGPGCAYWVRAVEPVAGSGSGSGRMVAGCSAPGSHRPRLALAPRIPAIVFPSSPVTRACYTSWPPAITVRVGPSIETDAPSSVASDGGVRRAGPGSPGGRQGDRRGGSRDRRVALGIRKGRGHAPRPEGRSGSRSTS